MASLRRTSELYWPDSCLCANLREITRAVTRAYDDALRPTGLRATQFTLLSTASALGDMPLTQLAEALVMDRTTLTRNLRPLIRQGLVETRSDEDQRVRSVAVTTAGEELLKQAVPLWRKAQGHLVEALGEQRSERLLRDLEKVLVAA